MAATPPILIDARPLQGPSARRGIGSYLRGLLTGLDEQGYSSRIALLIDGGLEPLSLPVAGLATHPIRRRYHGRLATYEDAVALAADLNRLRPRLYHATDLSLPASSPVKMLVTLHDLIPWAWPGVRMRGQRLRYRLGRRALRSAAGIIAVSNVTAEDACRLASVPPSRIQVVPEAPAAAFRPRPGAAGRVAQRWGLAPGRYLVHAGSLDARKDPAGLVRAAEVASGLAGGLELALAGDPGRQAPAAPRAVRRLGHVSDDELADILTAAGCLVFASRYEGFGLPILEAMACGCPVAAYSNSSIPEVAGRAAALVEDGDADALGAAAAQMVMDADRRKTAVRAGLARARGFTWAQTAKATIAVYESLLR